MADCAVPIEEALLSEKKPDMRAVKAAANVQFGHIPGVEGFGIGDDRLRVYVDNAAVRDQLPLEFQGVPLDLIVTGPITVERS
jgi:hypothetical protein